MIVNYSKQLVMFLKQFATVYEDIVPSGITPPNEYIVYDTICGNFADPFIQPITVYCKSNSYTRVKEIASEIEREIGEGGIVLRNSWGNVIVYKGSPYYQNKPETDENYKAGFVNLEIKITQKNV